MAQLLVSVRSVAEGELALAAGAGLIDVKEPAHGPLGRAALSTITSILQRIAGRRPVSAALGELRDHRGMRAVPGLAYVKWGLAGCAGDPDWRRRFHEAARRMGRVMPSCQAVAVAYADWQRAAAPPPAAVADLAGEAACGAFLLDTFGKDGSTLLDWLSVAEVERLCHDGHAAGVRVALAGALGAAEIQALRSAAPDWFGVRSAVCQGNCRGAVLDPVRVQRLVDLLAESLSTSAS